MHLHTSLALLLAVAVSAAKDDEKVRKMGFGADSREDAQAWQVQGRDTLFRLMMGGVKPNKVDPEVRILNRTAVPEGQYVIEEIELKSLSDRTVHGWLTVPVDVPPKGLPGMLALHGHGGTGEMIVRGEGLYGYGKAFAERGYVVATLDLGQHELQHENWSLMGERTWDALAVLDYLCERPEVDPERVGTAGLSLGGETVMYVAALDERIKVAVSSGWLTTVENMKNKHCPCWNFPGLEEHFDFSDIFSCVAPRHLMAQIGRKERAPGGFPVDIAEPAFAEIKRAYSVFGVPDRSVLHLHGEGHVFDGEAGYRWVDGVLKK